MQQAGSCLLHDGQTDDCCDSHECWSVQGRDPFDWTQTCPVSSAAAMIARVARLRNVVVAFRGRDDCRTELATEHDLRWCRLPNRLRDFVCLGRAPCRSRLFKRCSCPSPASRIESRPRRVEPEPIKLSSIRFDPAGDSHVRPDHPRRGERARERNSLNVCGTVDVGRQQVQPVVSEAEEYDRLQIARRERFVTQLLQERYELRCYRMSV